MSDVAEDLEPVHLEAPAVRLAQLNLRWVVAAVVMGTLSAGAAACVRLGFRGLQWLFTHSAAAAPVACAQLPLWRRVATPLLGALLATLVLWLRRRRAHRLHREPRAYVDYVEAVRHCGGRIPFVPNCWRTASAAFSVASGAAVGREGSMIQFAAAVSSVCGDWLARRLGRRQPLPLGLLVALGVAGGVTTAYNAPMAAVFFAAEITLGGLAWRELLLLGVASAAGWCVSGEMLGFARLYPVHVAIFAEGWRLLLLPALAVLFGVLGPVYQAMIQNLHRGRELPLPLLWSGLLVGLLSLYDPRVWGNGDLGLDAALGHAGLLPLAITVPALAVLLAMRLFATDVCVGTGTVGGVFTPTLFAGAATGALLGHALPGAEPAFWALAGMSCLMAAVTHAPVMAACMAAELTGDWRLLPWLLVANLIAWRVARRLSPHALYAIATQVPAKPRSAPRAAPAGV